MTDIKLTVLPETLTGFKSRPAVREDTPAIQELLEAGEAVEPRGYYSNLDDVYREFDEIDVDPAKDTILVFDENEKLAGFMWVGRPLPDAMREYRIFVWGEVHPLHRRKGLGGFLMEWGEMRAREIFAEFPNHLPKVIRIGVLDSLKDWIALYEKHGMKPARYFYRMRRDLSQEIPEVKLPDGIQIVRWTPELDEATLHVFNESFQDHWGFDNLPLEMWQNWFSQHPEFLPDCTFLAFDGDKAVSVCVCKVRLTENEKTGQKEAWIQDVGTLRPYRGRGIASGLMCTAMSCFRENGYETAVLGVDVENPTGALRIYERLGFQAVYKSIAYEKVI